MVETLQLGWFHHQRLDLKRWNIVDGFSIFKRVPVRAMPKLRHVAFNLTDFGAVGDGFTLNTEAFEKAVLAISKLGKKGGGQPNVLLGAGLQRPLISLIT
ncbi:hypothetical protein L3X38_026752 [Prunus dulcis]|uniref:Pectin lyase-like superfamily protein n=1 Tax=Prunus dulcis TaxID=3755 RepID=A0AAD4VMJ7_PRUDU|nr:hypothetical protein L3X38_026752 [Prunus dulcis]